MSKKYRRAVNIKVIDSEIDLFGTCTIRFDLGATTYDSETDKVTPDEVAKHIIKGEMVYLVEYVERDTPN